MGAGAAAEHEGPGRVKWKAAGARVSLNDFLVPHVEQLCARGLRHKTELGCTAVLRHVGRMNQVVGVSTAALRRRHWEGPVAQRPPRRWGCWEMGQR